MGATDGLSDRLLVFVKEGAPDEVEDGLYVGFKELDSVGVDDVGVQVE